MHAYTNTDQRTIFRNLQQTLTVADIMVFLNISRGSAYKLCHEGHFRIKKIGKRGIRIDKDSFLEWYADS